MNYLKSTGLLFDKDEVLFAGMTLAVCPSGKEEPLADATGNPWLVHTLIGGIREFGLRLYPLDSIHVTPGGRPSPLSSNPLPGSIRASSVGFADVKLGVRFMPTEVFTAADAPADREFAVFLEGRCVRHPYGGPYNAVRVVKRFGKFYTVNRGGGDQEYPLPDGAKLVPIRHGASFAGLAANLPRQ